MKLDREFEKGRIFGEIALCGAAIKIGSETLIPDKTKAYAEFHVARAAPVITAYGTMLHPGTLANSWRSMHDQLFELNHKIRSYDATPDKTVNPRDYALGTVVAVEISPMSMMGGWRMTKRFMKTLL